MVFIESICNDEELVKRNIAAMKESSPEFEEKTEQETVRDFRSRIESYERRYQVDHALPACFLRSALCPLVSLSFLSFISPAGEFILVLSVPLCT